MTVALLPQQIPALSSVLKREFSAALPEVDVRFITLDHGIEYVNALQSDRADVAFLFSDTAYLAFAGELDGKPYDHLRGIAALDSRPVFLIVRSDSPIQRVEQLRGRRVSVGAAGSSTSVTGGIVLEALGISATKSHEPLSEAAEKLAAGALDAMFAIGDVKFDRFRGGLQGVRILSLSPATVAQLHRHHPFLKGTVVSQPSSSGPPALTIAVERLLVCRSELDPRVAYALTKALFKALPDLSLVYGSLRQMNVEDAPATLLPLHEGAARYYREQAGT